MDRKTQAAYQGVFSFIKSLTPQLNPSVVLSDFEQAMQNAALQVWPNARIVGCYFHFAQAIHRKIQQLHMHHLMQNNLEAEKAGHMLMALALLPAGLIITGVNVVKNYVLQHNLSVEFEAILEYIDNYWIGTVGVNTMSVADEPHRTNNALEGFYSRLLKIMGAHPSVWNFHEHLRDIELSQWLDYTRMAGGQRHVRPIRREYSQQNTRIFEATRHLTEGRYNVAQFLSRVSIFSKLMMNRVNRGMRQAEPVDQEGVAADGQPVAQVFAAEPMMPPPPPAQIQLDEAVAPPQVAENHNEIDVAQHQPRVGGRVGWRGGAARGVARRGQEGRGRGGRGRGEVIVGVVPAVEEEIADEPGVPNREHDGALQVPVQDAAVLPGYMLPEWPEAEAQQFSRRQLQGLQSINIQATDVVAQDGELACVACRTNKRTYMTEPCGHFVLCGGCVNVHRVTVQHLNGYPQPIRCPICRGTIINYRLVYQ